MRIEYNICDVCRKKKGRDELKNDFSINKKEGAAVFNDVCDSCIEDINKLVETLLK